MERQLLRTENQTSTSDGFSQYIMGYQMSLYYTQKSKRKKNPVVKIRRGQFLRTLSLGHCGHAVQVQNASTTNIDFPLYFLFD